MKKFKLSMMLIYAVLYFMSACGGGGGGAGSEEIPVTGVSLKSETSILVGETEQMSAQVKPANATNRNVTWKSSGCVQ
ncbi:MAG: Ig-like domain-containing protein [Spirochaetes bacterium]|nr:Ig-like domain-containing protein [Spirochaetota bacterium]